VYFNGKGVPKDVKKGLEWLAKSAEQGFEQAQQDLKQRHDEEAHEKETKRLEVMAKLLEEEDEENAKGGAKKAKKKMKKKKAKKSDCQARGGRRRRRSRGEPFPIRTQPSWWHRSTNPISIEECREACAQEGWPDHDRRHERRAGA
jgi:hypothetical protein